MSKSTSLEDKLIAVLATDKSLPKYKLHHVGAIPGRKFEIDLWWPKYKVGIECQGGVFMSKSGHMGVGQVRDYKKTNLAQINGIILLQCGTGMLSSENDRDEFLGLIKKALRMRGWEE